MAVDILQLVEPIELAIIDPLVVVDAAQTIIHFNRAFYSMLPRHVARGLEGRRFTDVLEFDLGDGEHSIVSRCWKVGSHIRLDEIRGHIKGNDQPMTFILSALPFFDDGQPAGALVIQRDVTDEAQVQGKYQEMLDSARREREQLRQVIRERTLDLLEASHELFRAQRELLAYKRGRLL